MDELRATLNALADKYGIEVVREETLLILRREALRAAAVRMQVMPYEFSPGQCRL